MAERGFVLKQDDSRPCRLGSGHIDSLIASAFVHSSNMYGASPAAKWCVRGWGYGGEQNSPISAGGIFSGRRGAGVKKGKP